MSSPTSSPVTYSPRGGLVRLPPCGDRPFVRGFSHLAGSSTPGAEGRTNPLPVPPEAGGPVPCGGTGLNTPSAHLPAPLRAAGAEGTGRPGRCVCTNSAHRYPGRHFTCDGGATWPPGGSAAQALLRRNPPCRTRWRRPRPPLSSNRVPARRRRTRREEVPAAVGWMGRPKRRSSGAPLIAPTWRGGRTSSAATACTATSPWRSAAGGPGRPASTGRTAPSWPPPPSTSRRCSRGDSRSRARAVWSCRSGARRAAPTPTRWRPLSASCTRAPSASAPGTSMRCWRWRTGEGARGVGDV